MLQRQNGGLLFKKKQQTIAASMGMGQGGLTPINALIDQASFNLPLSDLGSGQVSLVPLKAGSATPTFTRATTATTVLSNGLIGSVASGVARSYYDPSSTVTNLLLQSQTLDNGSWVVQNGCSIVANTTNAPDGSLTADTVQAGLTSVPAVYQSVTLNAGLTYTVSIYIKSGTTNTFVFGLRDATAAVWLYLVAYNGTTLVPASGSGTFTQTDVGNGWIRFSITTTNGANTAGYVYLYPESNGAVTGKNIYAWGAQVEQAATVGAYVPTTTTSVTRAQTYMGYLEEGQRTNLLLRSEEFDNASWTKTDTTVTADAIVSPDGTQNADLLTQGTAGTAFVAQSVTATADVGHTASIWLRRGNNDWICVRALNGGNRFQTFVNLATGALGTSSVTGTGVVTGQTIVAYPNGWYRLTLSGSVGSGATVITFLLIGATADNNATPVNNATYYTWGAQFEDNVSFASSYIPTTSATVTRNADVLTFAATGNLDVAQGSSYAELYSLNAAASGVFQQAVGTASGFLERGTANTSLQIRMNDGTTAATKSGLSDMATGSRKRASSWGAKGLAITGDGQTVATAAFDGAMGAGVLGIGCNASGTAQWFGTIKNVRIWQQQLTDSQLQAITAG